MTLPVRQTLKGRRAVVIGSGPGGLAAAIALTARGARVLVVESGAEAGGSLRPFTFAGRDFDAWPPLIAEPTALTQLFAEAEHRFSDFINTTREPVLRRFRFPSGSVDFPTGLEALVETVGAIERADAAKLPAFLRTVTGLADVWHEQREARSFGSFGGFGTTLRSGTLLGTLRTLANPRSAAKVVHDTFRSDEVRRMMLHFPFESGVDPLRARAAALAFLGREWKHGGWSLEGGAQALLGALLRLCDMLGIRILTGTHVDRIELKNGRVRRISGEGFKPLAVSIVVANCDALHALEHLFQEKHLVRTARRELIEARPARTRLVLRAVLAKAPASMSEGVVTVFPSEDLAEEVRQLDRWRVPATRPTISGSVVPFSDGTSGLTLVSHQPPLGERFRWTDARLAEERDRLFERLADRGVAIADEDILDEATIDPRQVAATTFNRFGTSEGTSNQTLRGMFLRRTGRLREIPGMYLVSPAIHPGAGLANAVHGGMTAAALAADDALG